MRKKGLFILLLISISVLFPAYLFLKSAFNYLSGYLSKSEQIKANILVVEGWIPDYALELALKEFNQNGYEYIITTGLKSFKRYFKLSTDGYLIFYPNNRFSGISESGQHLIEVGAFSQLGGDNRAHFNLFINDSLAADFFVEKQKKRYGITWKGYLKEIDSVMVEFNNDRRGEFGDRNLFVKEIKIDHKISIPYLNNSEYDILKLDGKRRIINDYISNAEIAKNRLLTLGLDSSIITAVTGKGARINRTLTSALAMRDWLERSGLKVKGINIISSGTHARRTWMTYRKILNEKYEIGIISLPDYKNNKSRKNKVLKVLRETVGIIYYWFILIPY